MRREPRRLAGLIEVDAVDNVALVRSSRVRAEHLWSPASFSAAERSAIPGKRSREFTADELLAFAAAFNLPIPFFLTPPPDVDRFEIGRKRANRASLISALIPPESDQARILEQVRQTVAQLHSKLSDSDQVAMQLGQNPRRKPKEKP
jgi:hypothetical protein